MFAAQIDVLVRAQKPTARVSSLGVDRGPIEVFVISYEYVQGFEIGGTYAGVWRQTEHCPS